VQAFFRREQAFAGFFRRELRENELKGRVEGERIERKKLFLGAS
jgi:hypothetical protein